MNSCYVRRHTIMPRLHQQVMQSPSDVSNNIWKESLYITVHNYSLPRLSRDAITVTELKAPCVLNYVRGLKIINADISCEDWNFD